MKKTLYVLALIFMMFYGFSEEVVYDTIKYSAFSQDAIADYTSAYPGGVTLVIPEALELSGDVIVPSSISLRIPEGSMLTVKSWETLTVNGGIIAGIYQIFDDQDYIDCDGVQGTPRVECIYPQWFGARTTAADNTKAFQACFNLISNGTMIIPAGSYRIANCISISLLAEETLQIIGQGFAMLDFRNTPDPSEEKGAIEIAGTSSSNIIMKNLNIEADFSTLGLLNGVYIKNEINILALENINVSCFGLWGIKIENSTLGQINNCYSRGNMLGGLGFFGSQGITVTGGGYSYNGYTAPDNGYGISCASDADINKNITIQGTTCYNNKRKSIDIHNGENIVVQGNHLTGGFGKSGIYAVSENSHKRVKNITIKNNQIEGSQAYNDYSVYGIEIGNYSGSSQNSGTFIVEGNTIQNLGNNSYDCGILIRTADDGGYADAIIISNNSIIEGRGAAASCIWVNNQGTAVKRIICTSNYIKTSVVGTYAICRFMNLEEILFDGNIIEFDGALTLTDAVYFTTNTKVQASNNKFTGTGLIASYFTKQAGFEDGDSVIGTIEPSSAPLNVRGGFGSNRGILSLISTDPENYAYMTFYNESLFKGFIGFIGNDHMWFNNGTSNGNMYFRTNNATRMTIDIDGNVGIGGASSSSDKLNVSGSVKISDVLNLIPVESIPTENGEFGDIVVVNSTSPNEDGIYLCLGGANWRKLAMD